MSEEVLTSPSISVGERLSIINALMSQDRSEIRDKQEAVFRLTYYVIPGLIGIAVFSLGRPQLRWALLVGQALLLALYVISFLTFRRWLADARACLQIREAFYKHPALLSIEPFEPIRPINQNDRVSRFEDNALWFPFGVTVAAAVVLLAYVSKA